MKKLLLTTAALCALAAPAHATLHMCYLTGCTTFDKVSISGATQPSGSDLSGWGVSSAKGGESGGLYIAMLAPTNESEVVLPTLTGTLNGSPLTIESWANEGAFGSNDKLSSVLGTAIGGTVGAAFSSATPPGPFDAYDPSTRMLDAGETGYTVYLAKVDGTFTTGTKGGQTNLLDNSFSLTGGDYDVGTNEFSGVGPGAILTSFLLQSTTKRGVTTYSVDSTAQSSSLILDGPGTMQHMSSVPEPSTWAMMIVGFAGIGYMTFRRGQKESLSRTIA